ncbi:MAG: MarR family winged helix-turn-helix transcriptional regulator [Rhodospirillales bacterium]
MPTKIKNSGKLPPSESVGFLIRDTMMHIQIVLRAKLQRDGLSTAQYYLLRVLWEEEGLSQRELSDRVCTTEPTTQSALLRMEKKGLVRRVKNKIDRRANHIYLTAKGRNLEIELIPVAIDINNMASKGISKSDLKLFNEVIKKIRTNVLLPIHT